MLNKTHTAYRQTHTPEVGVRKTKKFNIILVYCAAGAISKECKRVSVPEVLFKQLLKRIDRTTSDPLFWATCGRRAVFEVENR